MVTTPAPGRARSDCTGDLGLRAHPGLLLGVPCGEDGELIAHAEPKGSLRLVGYMAQKNAKERIALHRSKRQPALSAQGTAVWGLGRGTDLFSSRLREGQQRLFLALPCRL